MVSSNKNRPRHIRLRPYELKDGYGLFLKGKLAARPPNFQFYLDLYTGIGFANKAIVKTSEYR